MDCHHKKQTKLTQRPGLIPKHLKVGIYLQPSPLSIQILVTEKFALAELVMWNSAYALVKNFFTKHI